MVNAGRANLTFHTHQAGLPFLGQAQVILTQDGDDIAGLQHQIVCGVTLQHGFAEVEGNEFSAEFVTVKALNDSVVPVDLVGDTVRPIGDVGASRFGGINVLHQLVLAFVIVGRDQSIALGD